jgi:hypothetical protein
LDLAGGPSRHAVLTRRARSDNTSTAWVSM